MDGFEGILVPLPFTLVGSDEIDIIEHHHIKWMHRALALV